MPTFTESLDAAASSSTTYSLTAGQSIQGTLTGSGDHDWYRVTLTAGQTYTFALSGTGTNNVIDTFLRLYAADGTTVLADNDDGLPNLNSLITYTATTSGTYYLDASSFQPSTTGQYQFTYNTGNRIGFDTSMGAGVIDTNYAWNVIPGAAAIVTYGFRNTNATYAGSVTDHNLSTFSRLTASEMATVRNTLRMWSEICNVNFIEVNPGGYTDSATILFSNYTDAGDGSGAFAYYPGSTVATDSAGDVWLNTTSISTTQTLDYGSYGFFAIMHELGHAIGLSHPGLYNAAPGLSITYANNAQFTQDTQQYTIMSYFDETSTGGNFGAYANSPMLFDIYAAQRIYGANMLTRNTNTTYGFNSNAGAPYNFTTGTTRAFCIWDGGGTDTIDASGYSQAQTINLNAESFSNIGGLTSNISIANGVVIENAIGGSGADTITGNSADNTINGRAGNDIVSGGAGNDSLFGEDGTDTIFGGTGNDMIITGFGDDTAYGEDGNDTMFGEFGNDTLIGGFGDDIVQGQDGNDTLFGEFGNDTLVSGTGNDTLYGQDGFDTLSGEDGADRLYGGTGDDIVICGFGDDVAFGESGHDTLFGEYGNDTLVGGDGNDTIFGQDGGDFLIGSGGADNLVGGANNDIFYFDNPTDAADLVHDFNRLEGDRLAFSAAAFGVAPGFTLTAGVNFFAGANALPNSAVTTLYYDSNTRALWFDADGTGAGAAHVVSFMLNNPTLQASDIIFL
ncbi:MAG: M10 family metallopeptidase C-terminal domain-containing protein [Proteobacteria bacterium]|nr:M10 family metallopeptidase C-terminal domain-containing protein [Pseudomonadota bacterium]